MRGKTASWIAKGLFILLAFSFIGWGATDFIRSSTNAGPVIQVGNAKLEMALAQRAVSQELNLISRQLPGVDRSQLRQLGLVDQAAQQVASRLALDQEVQRFGLAVGDETLRQTLTNNPAFRAPGGGFDRTRFNQTINQMGFTEQGFLEEFRRDTARAYITRTLTDVGAPPATLTQHLLTYRGETRNAEVVKVSAEDPASIAAPTPEALQEFYKANGSRFTSAERRTISYLLLSPASFKDGITVTDKELSDYFAEHIDSYGQPERRAVVQVVLADEAKAKELATKAAADGDLAKAAAEAGASVSDLGTVTRDKLTPALAEAAFKLEEGKVSGPVAGDFGYHILKVTSVQPAIEAKFDAVKEQIAEEIKNNRALDRLYEVSNKLDEILNNGTPLKDAAAQIGVALQSAPAFERNGEGDAGEVMPDLPGRNALINLAFQTDQGQTSRIIELPGGMLAAVHVDAVAASSQKPFETVKADVELQWRARTAARQAREKADALAATIKSGKSLEDAATEAGAVIEVQENVSRDGNNGQMSPQAVAALFAAAQPGDIAVAEDPAGAVVVKFTGTKAAEPEKLTAEKAALDAELREAIAGDTAQIMQNYLRQRYPVHIDKQRLDTLF